MRGGFEGANVIKKVIFTKDYLKLQKEYSKKKYQDEILLLKDEIRNLRSRKVDIKTEIKEHFAMADKERENADAIAHKYIHQAEAELALAEKETAEVDKKRDLVDKKEKEVNKSLEVILGTNEKKIAEFNEISHALDIREKKLNILKEQLSKQHLKTISDEGRSNILAQKLHKLEVEITAKTDAVRKQVDSFNVREQVSLASIEDSEKRTVMLDEREAGIELKDTDLKERENAVEYEKSKVLEITEQNFKDQKYNKQWNARIVEREASLKDLEEALKAEDKKLEVKRDIIRRKRG